MRLNRSLSIIVTDKGLKVMVIVRALYYFWVVLFFPLSYMLVPGFSAVLDRPGFVIVGFLVNAILMGWLGDAIIFGRSTIANRSIDSTSLRWVFVAFVIFAPLFAMSSDLFAQ